MMMAVFMVDLRVDRRVVITPIFAILNKVDCGILKWEKVQSGVSHEKPVPWHGPVFAAKLGRRAYIARDLRARSIARELACRFDCPRPGTCLPRTRRRTRPQLLPGCACR